MSTPQPAAPVAPRPRRRWRSLRALNIAVCLIGVAAYSLSDLTRRGGETAPRSLVSVARKRAAVSVANTPIAVSQSMTFSGDSRTLFGLTLRPRENAAPENPLRGARGEIVAWDVATGRRLWSAPDGGQSLSGDIAASRDGRSVALTRWRVAPGTGAGDTPRRFLSGALQVRDARTGALRFTATLPADVAPSDTINPAMDAPRFAFSPDASRLVIAGKRSVRVLNPRSAARPRAAITLSSDTPVHWARFSRDGKTLVVASLANKDSRAALSRPLVHLTGWDLRARRRIPAFAAASAPGVLADISRDGAYLAVGYPFGVQTVGLLDAASGARLRGRPSVGYEANLAGLAFSYDGASLLLDFDKGIQKRWRHAADPAGPLNSLTPAETDPYMSGISPDGRYSLIFSDADGDGIHEKPNLDRRTRGAYHSAQPALEGFAPERPPAKQDAAPPAPNRTP